MVSPESAENLVWRTSSELQTDELMDKLVITLTVKLSDTLPHSEEHGTRVPTGHKTFTQVVLSPMAKSPCVSRQKILGTQKSNQKNNIAGAHLNQEKRTKSRFSGL